MELKVSDAQKALLSTELEVSLWCAVVHATSTAARTILLNETPKCSISPK